MKEIKKGELGVVGRGVSGGRVGPVCNQKRERERKRVFFFFFFGVFGERERERERERRLQHQDSEGDSKSQLAMKEEAHLTFPSQSLNPF